MNTVKLKSAFEVATSIIVLLSAMAISTVFLTNYYRQRQAVKLEFETGLAKGGTLPSVQGLTYADSARTLLLVMNAHCVYCAESVPFYNRIVEAQTSAGSPVKIVALFPNPDAEVKTFVDNRSLKATVMSGANLSQLKLAGTPTVVLVDGAGRIQDFWVGKLTPESEEEVLRSVARL
jgi:hypothetical protein